MEVKEFISESKKSMRKERLLLNMVKELLKEDNCKDVEKFEKLSEVLEFHKDKMLAIKAELANILDNHFNKKERV